MRKLIFAGWILMFMTSNCLNIEPHSVNVKYVDINGNDSTGDGTIKKPWRTLGYAASKIPADKSHSIKLSPGVFIEDSFVNIPSGVDIEGSGADLTVIKANPKLAFNNPRWHLDKFIISLAGFGGKQTITDLAIDGDEKQLYGGIIVQDRNNVTIKNVNISNCYYTGIWFWNVNDSRITESTLTNNAHGDKNGASASIILTECTGLEVDHLSIDETDGQALDVVMGKMHNLDLHHNSFSVNPKPNWETPDGTKVPNICVEMFNAELQNVSIHHNYFDNSLSVVMDHQKFKRTGTQTVKITDNVFNLNERAKGSGYGIELMVNDAEISNNYFVGGSSGIVNWEVSGAPPRQRWDIHHNIFYGLSCPNPTGIINFFRNGIDGATIYNNTVEMTGTSTVSFIEVSNGGMIKNTRIENNLIINSNTDYEHYPNKFINLSNGSAENVSVKNNFLEQLQLENLNSVVYENNLTGNSRILKTGNRPNPYYIPTQNSPLIDAGLITGTSFSGSAPDIGAFEHSIRTDER